jgi:subtilisin-like proprotein convertase family protein
MPLALRLLRPRVAIAAAVALCGLAAAPAAHAAIVVDHVSAGLTEVGGNGDGVVAPGENFALTERIRHADVAPFLTNIQGSLVYDPGAVAQSGPTLVTLTNGLSGYPDLSFGAEADNLTPFTGALSAAAECGVNLDFVLSVSATQGNTDVPFKVGTGVAGPTVARESADVPTAIADAGTTLSGLGVTAPGRVKDVAVRIGDLDHTRTGDLKIELVSPNNVSMVLVDTEGASGQDFSNTTFSDSASQSIVGKAAPFNGTYRPEQPLSKFIGRSQQGTWHLRITDQQGTETGQLNAWGMDLRTAVCSGTPVAAFTATPNPQLPGQAVQFDASESTDANGTIVKYEWDLDNDATFEVDGGASPTHSHVFPTRGQYPVELRVTDDEDNQSTTTVNVSVTQPPVAAFTAAPPSPLTGEDVTLDASTSSDPDGAPLARFEWDLDGDGNFELDTATTATTTTQYATPGTRSVRVRVTDQDGATDVASVDVVVRNRPPTASLSGPAPAIVGQPATISAAASSDPDGTIDRYEWDLDDDGTYETDTGAVDEVQQTYVASGSVTVGVRVTDDQGDADTEVLTIVVTDAPVASFTATPNPTSLHQPVALDAGGSSDADGTVARYEWDLDGDGTYETDTGTTASSSRVYHANGAYVIRLRVTDDDGAQDVATVNVAAANKLPAAAIVTTPGQATAGQAVTLDGRGSSDVDGTLVKYDWDLDGNGSFEATTGATATRAHTYPNVGRFTVGVRVTDNDGGISTATYSLTVAQAASDGGSGSADGSGGASGGGASDGSGGADGGAGAGEGATGRLRASLTGHPLQRIAPVVSRGLAFGCQADRAARCELRAQLRAVDARRLGLRVPRDRPFDVGRITVSVSASGKHTARLRLSAVARRALRRAREVPLLVRGSVAGSDGGSRRVYRVFLLRR